MTASEARFLKSLKACEISKVVVIDDVFDAPTLNGDNSGAALDYLEGEAFEEIMSELEITYADRSAAKDAIAQSQYADEGVKTCIARIYSQYVKTGDPKYDPSGIFSAAKSANLENLKPLIALLNKAAHLEVKWIGSDEADLDGIGADTHLVFIDYYLDERLPAEGAGHKQQCDTAREAALGRVRSLIAKHDKSVPSVVLMSSHKVREKADAFRAELGQAEGKVFASRFSFIEKTHLRLADKGAIEIEDEAADALLDIVQTYKFGRALNVGLEGWLASAKKAVEALHTDISDLSLKELAYLVRFRLAAEGQDLLSYLEWFFGECLAAKVSSTFDETGIATSTAKDLTGTAVMEIEGAFDGPTEKIAALYHCARIEDPRPKRTRLHRLGDLYLQGDSKPQSIFAVLSPDCDLIPRGPKHARRAQRALTVEGRLNRYDAPETTLSDFILVNGTPYNIKWNMKAVSTREFDELPDSGTKGKLEYAGSLKPMYAQGLQRSVFNDLNRIGLSVAPAFGMAAAVVVKFKTRSGKVEPIHDVSRSDTAACYVVPARDTEDKPRAIFRRGFVGDLIAALTKLAPDNVVAAGRGYLKQLAEAETYAKLMKMSGEGIPFEELIDLGIFLTGKANFKSASDGPWCWLTVSMSDTGEN